MSEQNKLSRLTKAEKSWILYDVANSAFVMIVTATIPIYFRSLAENAGVSAAHASSIWGTTTSIAILILALLSPILGAIADFENMKKRIFICMYIAICIFGYGLDKEWEFWVLAFCVGLCQGGIQALSRSYFGKLIPKESSSEYFGFFDIFGKFADFMGPLLISASAFFFGNSKYGILSLIVLFVIGLYLISKSEKAAHN